MLLLLYLAYRKCTNNQSRLLVMMHIVNTHKWSLGRDGETIVENIG